MMSVSVGSQLKSSVTSIHSVGNFRQASKVVIDMLYKSYTMRFLFTKQLQYLVDLWHVAYFAIHLFLNVFVTNVQNVKRSKYFEKFSMC